MRFHFGRILGAILLACALPAAAQQTYDGPPSSMTRYWEVPGFKDLPHMGPDKALGMIFWSHGLAGNMAQYQYPPPPIIYEFARRGWDVAKVQRNPIFETLWSESGPRHVADVLERVAKARAAGYKSIILAGQSYGGAIALEAAGRTDQVFGVLAFAPGHGSDACGAPGAMRIADMLAASLMPAIEKVKSPRVVVSMAAGDTCQGTNNPGPQIERSLQSTKAKYIHFDQTMPIRGHGAAGTTQFSTWYSDCLIAFMAPDKQPAGTKTVCPAPTNARFLVPANVKLEAPAGKSNAAADMTGPWLGKAGTAETCVVVDKVTPEEATGTAYFGSGPGGTAAMMAMPFRAKKNGKDYVYQGTAYYTLSLTPKDADLTMSIVSADGRNRYTSQMKRGCIG
jgi:pimeloyl-ACP methyl ester carboxylesterase